MHHFLTLSYSRSHIFKCIRNSMKKLLVVIMAIKFESKSCNLFFTKKEVTNLLNPTIIPERKIILYYW
jgi:hypothetical protein